MALKVDVLHHGDNLEIMRMLIPDDSVDLVYLDPPFFTGKSQSSIDRTLSTGEDDQLSFSDVWASHEEYLEWIRTRLQEVHRALRPSGSVFLHCDWHASHLLRVELDQIFHPAQFRGEIIWYYKRWTNTLRTFQRAHQSILFYSKTASYKFNPLYEDYSFTTNIEQIWQRRGRAGNGKSITITGDDGRYVPLGHDKPGVPMRDVWEIPYLNPRAKERTGWPTQKPVELLRRIVLACTDEGDVVLDPVCGSGTTLVAAKALGRHWIGIDCSPEAIEISRRRLASRQGPFASELHHAPYRLARFLDLPRGEKLQHIGRLIGMHVVQRNANLDGLLKRAVDGAHVPVRYVDNREPAKTISRFVHTAKNMQAKVGIVILPRVMEEEKNRLEERFHEPVRVIVLTYEDITRKGFRPEGVLLERQAALDIG